MSDPASGSYRWVLLFGVWLVYFAFGLTQVAMAPLIGVIRMDLGLSDGAMGLILGAWPLVYIAFAMPCGAFLDRVGPRKALFAAAAIIALSAAAMPGDIEKGKRAGFLRYITKPFVVDEIIVTIGEALQKTANGNTTTKGNRSGVEASRSAAE